MGVCRWWSTVCAGGGALCAGGGALYYQFLGFAGEAVDRQFQQSHVSELGQHGGHLVGEEAETGEGGATQCDRWGRV